MSCRESSGSLVGIGSMRCGLSLCLGKGCGVALVEYHKGDEGIGVERKVHLDDSGMYNSVRILLLDQKSLAYCMIHEDGRKTGYRLR